jgi:hypothetical protein
MPSVVRQRREPRSSERSSPEMSRSLEVRMLLEPRERELPDDCVELGEPDMPLRPPWPLWPERLTSPSSSSERDDARMPLDDDPSPGEASSRMPLRCEAERDRSSSLD